MKRDLLAVSEDEVSTEEEEEGQERKELEKEEEQKEQEEVQKEPEKEEEEQKEQEGEQEEDEMPISTISSQMRSKSSSSNPTTPNMAAVVHAEGSTRRCKQKRASTDHHRAKSIAMERAKEVKSNLEPSFPSFVKSMSRSHVQGECRLGIPSYFANTYLPRDNIEMKLVDENREESTIRYLFGKTALTVGWKAFVSSHNLLQGDALVFQLVKPSELQVYIIRAYGTAEISGGNQNSDSAQIKTQSRIQNSDTAPKKTRSRKRAKTSEKTALVVHQQPGLKSDSDEVNSEILEGARLSENTLPLKELQSLSNFSIAVDGVIIDSELSEEDRSKYYELCCSQNAFLHGSLFKGINAKLAAGVLSQIVSIADSIKSSQISTSPDVFTSWDNKLGAFEQLGMSVGFLRARIQKLVNVAFESEEGVDMKRYKEAIAGRDSVKEEIKSMKAKLEELEEASKKYDTEIETLKPKVGHHVSKYQAEVDVPWCFGEELKFAGCAVCELDICQVDLDHAEESTSRKRASFVDHDKAKSCAMERAEEVQANLDPQFPSFVKSMLRSHVTRGFWLGLPPQFCKTHLPKVDLMVNLVDENQENYEVKYLFERHSLSGGWRSFSVTHKLVEGDALVFQIVKPTEFQVYIIRAYSMAEVNGVIAYLGLDAPSRRITSCKGTKLNYTTFKKRQQVLSPSTFQQPGGIFGSDSEAVDSEVLEGAGLSETTVEFKDMKNLNNFRVVVNGLIIDSELSKHARAKYYELCCSQNAFLHDNLSLGINPKLAAGTISQILSIADGIKSSNLNTSRYKYAEWEKNLYAFEQLGMNVSFLRARIRKLVSVAFDSEMGSLRKKCRKALVKRDKLNVEIKTLKSEVAELETASKRLESYIEKLQMMTEYHEVEFQEEVGAPW